MFKPQRHPKHLHDSTLQYSVWMHLCVKTHARLPQKAPVMIAKRRRHSFSFLSLSSSQSCKDDGYGMSVGPAKCEPIPGVLYQHECGPRRYWGQLRPVQQTLRSHVMAARCEASWRLLPDCRSWYDIPQARLLFTCQQCQYLMRVKQLCQMYLCLLFLLEHCASHWCVRRLMVSQSSCKRNGNVFGMHDAWCGACAWVYSAPRYILS